MPKKVYDPSIFETPAAPVEVDLIEVVDVESGRLAVANSQMDADGFEDRFGIPYTPASAIE